MFSTPDVIIPGIAKSGTTALATLLARHSRLALISPKEPHYYSWGLAQRNNVTHKSKILSTQEYTDAIKQVRNGDKLVIDASTSYTHPGVILDTVEQIKTHCPDTRFIFSVRDPIKRLISDWKMRATEGWGPMKLSTSIEEALTELMAALNVNSHQKLLDNIASNDSWLTHRDSEFPAGGTLISHGFYDRLLALYQQHFSEQVLVITQEQLRQEPDATLALCFNHLNLQPEIFSDNNGQYNASDYRRDTWLAKLIRQGRLAPIAKSILPKSLFTLARNAVTKEVSQPQNDLAEHSYLHDLLVELYRITTEKTHRQVQQRYSIHWKLQSSS